MPELRRAARAKLLVNVGLASLALVTAGVVGFALFGPSTAATPAPSSSLSSTAPAPTVPTTVRAAEKRLTMAQAAEKLTGTTEPFTLAIIGDSTGFGPQSWVRQTVEQIVEQTGRPALIHEWNPTTGAYDPPNRVGPAGAETITVWNGSASGRNAQYSVDHLAAMLPGKADLIIVNHGHNLVSIEAADRQIRALLLAIRGGANELTAVAFTMQNPRTDAETARGEAVRAVIGNYVKTIEEVTVIDAYTAFQSAGNVPALLNSDGLHPVRAGYTIWANTVLPLLGLRPEAA